MEGEWEVRGGVEDGGVGVVVEVGGVVGEDGG